MDVTDFIHKWRKVKLTERSASHEHFFDLCALLDHETPVTADPEGATFTFEKGVHKRSGGEGWADVWKRGCFAWEYKGKHKDLDAAYDQLQQYREDLENPPLLVVWDMDRMVIRTNFTATVSKTHEITLLGLREPENLEIVKGLFHEPEKLKPGVSREGITRQAADELRACARCRNRAPVKACAYAPQKHHVHRYSPAILTPDLGVPSVSCSCPHAVSRPPRSTLRLALWPALAVPAWLPAAP